MTMITVPDSALADLLRSLLNQPIQATAPGEWTPHDATFKGFVNDANELRGVIASDLDFAHRSAAALAMLPMGVVERPATQPEDHLIEMYGEIANVLSQVANEATVERVRLDPGLELPLAELKDFIGARPPAVQSELSIGNFGSGTMGMWLSDGTE